jgi:hypothetical protein
MNETIDFDDAECVVFAPYSIVWFKPVVFNTSRFIGNYLLYGERPGFKVIRGPVVTDAPSPPLDDPMDDIEF